jgi:hypothetical protein
MTRYRDFRSIRNIYEKSAEYKISVLVWLFYKHFITDIGNVSSVSFDCVNYGSPRFLMPYARVELKH